MAIEVQVTFDCADPEALGTFWASVLGYVEQPPPAGFDTWDAFLDSIDVPADERDTMYAVVDPDGDGPRFLFQKVPEGKSAKNRMHLDVNVGKDNMHRRSDELVALGATFVREYEEPSGHWLLMQDPEGNEFCLQ